MYMSAVSVTEARKAWSDYFTRAVTGRWPVAIERGGDDLAVLIGADELGLLLDGYAFAPEVFFEANAVSIWLSEFALYGRGRTFEDARLDLVDEVRAYVAEYLGDAPLYLRSPNRAQQFPWVLKAYLTDVAGRLEDVLFAPAGPVAPAPRLDAN